MKNDQVHYHLGVKNSLGDSLLSLTTTKNELTLDNTSSDFALALQEWGDEFHLGCLRENPLNSLHWHDPVEQHLASTGDWTDLDYDACVFLGARKKSQKLRHNIPELSMLPSLRCGHIHSTDEWSRTSGRFPTFAEAEYTPSLVFTIAVAVTAWAHRIGWGCQPIPTFASHTNHRRCQGSPGISP